MPRKKFSGEKRFDRIRRKESERGRLPESDMDTGEDFLQENIACGLPHAVAIIDFNTMLRLSVPFLGVYIQSKLYV